MAERGDDIFRGSAADAPLLTPAHLSRAANAVNPALPIHLVQAVADVEAAGVGYLPDGRLKCLFEARWFDRLTNGRFRAAHPTLSTPEWDSTLYWGGAAEYVRLGRAMALDRRAALEATSWGAGQQLGVNHALCGYPDVEAMIRAFADDPAASVVAIVRFLLNRGALDRLRAHDFEAVSRVYNGPGYARTRHHLKLATAAAARSGRALAGLGLGEASDRVAALQRALAADGHDPGAIDGAYGPRSAGALLAWQRAHRAPGPELEH